VTESVNERFRAASRLISEGDPAGALEEARNLYFEASKNPLVWMNCAGIFIDAGERLGELATVEEGVQILDRLHAQELLPATHQMRVRYNLANGKSALIKMRSPSGSPTSDDVRDMRQEEEVVTLYYDSSDSLRSAPPEQVINCAAMLRLESRVHEAIDLLDHVLRCHPEHPNAHMKMAEMLWAAFAQARWRDGMPEALLIPALVHYGRAAAEFDATGEPVFSASTCAEARRLRELAGKVLNVDVDEAVKDVGEATLGESDRLGAPLGLRLLARSPYRDEDDLWLAEDVEAALQDIFTDAAGTFAVGRSLLRQSNSLEVAMPRWGAQTPSAEQHLRHASVRQFWSVLEKVAWLLNEAFGVGLTESQCTFASLFRPPSKEVKKEFGLPTVPGSARFHPKLQRENPGLRALAGLSCAFDTEADGAVYVPLKRLRHAVVHRVPDQLASQDDAAFLMGIARAALLHAVDALIAEQVASS